MAQRENDLIEPLVKYFESEMARLGWSQADVVRKAKLDPGVVSRSLRRETVPDLPTLQGFADALGISLGELQRRAVFALHGIQENRPTLPQDEPSAGEGLSVPPAGLNRAPEEPRSLRSRHGQLLRLLMAADERLRTRVGQGGVGQAEVAAIAADQAGQMLADRLAAVIRQTFEDNEIADTKAGRQFTVAFLDRIVEEFGAMGLNVTDLARYANELRREQGHHQ